jgi:hypothetical protein
MGFPERGNPESRTVALTFFAYPFRLSWVLPAVSSSAAPPWLSWMPVTPTSSAVRLKCNTLTLRTQNVTTYDVGPAGPASQARTGLGVLMGEKMDEGLMATLRNSLES